MFGKKKTASTFEKAPAEKPTPAFLRSDYPYQAVGDVIENIDTLEDGVVYEIKCHACEMSIRSQGKNIKSINKRLKESGCIGCGNKELIIRRVDMSHVPTNTTE